MHYSVSQFAMRFDRSDVERLERTMFFGQPYAWKHMGRTDYILVATSYYKLSR